MKYTVVILCSTISLYLFVSTAIDTIAVNQSIRDGETIVSAGGTFCMGFFSPGSSTNRYVGIWYHKISTQTVVWVANRETPITNTSGILTLTPEGILKLQSKTSAAIVWSTNSSESVKNPIAKLFDTGNLVIGGHMEGDLDHFLWESFDYPGDTHLAGFKMGKDFSTGRVRELTSWKSPHDPSIGENAIWMETEGYPQLYQRKGSVIVYRIGPWNGVRWSGLPNLRENPIFSYEFVFNHKEVYYKYELKDSSVISRLILTPEGNMIRMNWIDRTQGWHFYSSPALDSCNSYNLCGAYGSCNMDHSPACGCLQGFEPRRLDEWSVSDWSSGCQRRKALDCKNGDGFRKYSHLKLPDSRGSWFNQTMNLEECKMECLNKCSCTAYSNTDIRDGGSGCLLWFGELVDIRVFSEYGDDLYIRMAASEIENDGLSNMYKRATTIGIPVGLILFLILSRWLYRVFKRRRLSKKGNLKRYTTRGYNNESDNVDLELPLFSLSTLLVATNNFSASHKLGEGGFGPVYKGKLLTGKEIAVKRLSKNSIQGLEEFKNEIGLISKLQHRNLVKILGYCLEGEERILVYEYFPNKSLDNFIFNKDTRPLLSWKTRLDIIVGIAKGLLYLHYDSRLRIIHRDLKASNILLDGELNPKISDFGIAKTFGGDQTEGKTRHVIGTYGYMSPEYVFHGKFSVKSDVFSFGVLLIEIVSGRKNTKYRHPDHHHGLLGHAWLLWNKGRALELVDALDDAHVKLQVLRYIHVGLLCIQNSPEDRPTISSVILMLSNQGMTLPKPKQPGFFIETDSNGKDMSTDEVINLTRNEVTITILDGR